MSLPEAVKRLLFQFAAIFPVPTGQPGEAHEERVRQWTYRFCQQVAFSFPGEGYGAKSAGEGRPISKDSLARKTHTLESWDLLLGTGTGNPQLAHDPEYHHIPTQTFVKVTPVDYLGSQVPQEDDEDVPAPRPAPQPPHVCPVGVPKHSYADTLSLANDLDSAYRAETNRTVHPEPLAHWIWRYQFEGYSRDALIAQAVARGIDEA